MKSTKWKLLELLKELLDIFNERDPLPKKNGLLSLFDQTALDRPRILQVYLLLCQMFTKLAQASIQGALVMR